MVQTSNGPPLALGFLDGECLGSCAVLCLPASITACCSARGPKCGRRSGFPSHGALIWLQLPRCLLAHPLESPLHVHLEELQHQRESGSGGLGRADGGIVTGISKTLAGCGGLQQQHSGHSSNRRWVMKYGSELWKSSGPRDYP